MPIGYSSQLQLRKIPVLGLVPESAATGPSAPVVGQLWYDTANNQLKYWNGTAWTIPGSGSGGPPSGTAGGDLGGSYPNPTVLKAQSGFAVQGAGLMTAADLTNTGINPAASVFEGKVSGDTQDRTNLTAGGVLNFGPGNAATDTNLYRQSAGTLRTDTALSVGGLLTAAGAAMGGQKVTGMADPTAATDGATKNYVDTTAQGLDTKQSVKAATTANITLSGTQTIDGVALVAGDRVLVKNQTTTSANGIYVVAAGAWARAADLNVWSEFPGAYTFVEQGTAQADTGWVCTADQGGTLETTAVTWVQFSGAGTYQAGAGLNLTGNTFSIPTSGVTSAMILDGTVAASDLAAGAVNLAGTAVTGILPIAAGGTNGGTAPQARSSLTVAGVFSNTLAALTAGVELSVLISPGLYGGAMTGHVQFFNVSDGSREEFAWRWIDTTHFGVTSDIAYGAGVIRWALVGAA